MTWRKERERCLTGRGGLGGAVCALEGGEAAWTDVLAVFGGDAEGAVR